jgi:hypothetical protein
MADLPPVAVLMAFAASLSSMSRLGYLEKAKKCGPTRKT